MRTLDTRLASPAAVVALVLALSAAASATAAPPSVGDLLADLSLSALDESQRTLSERDGTTVLVFFRGVW